jgi:hypothetical protein
MASVGSVNLTITQLPNSRNVVVTVEYQLVGDEVDVALQTPYREVCQLTGVDSPAGPDDVLLTIRDSLTFFPEDPVTSNRILPRRFDRVVPLSALDEDNDKPFQEEDEIRAKVTLTLLGPNFRESRVVRVGGPVVIGQGAQPGTDGAPTVIS